MSLLIDSNILILLLVGSYDSKFIEHVRRLRNNYDEKDYLLVKNLVKKERKIYITPQILSEISNLTKDIRDPKLTAYIKNLISQLNRFSEEYIHMTDLFKDEKLLIKVGFTDLSVIKVAKKFKCLILTDDFVLNSISIDEGCESLNITQLRGKKLFLNS